MGCGSSAPGPKASELQAAPGAELCSVIVWGARGLRAADSFSEGDPYCIARVGPKGSSWDQKLRSSGRRSATISGTANPDWHLGFSADVAGMEAPELQVRIYDQDWCSADDFLGEAVAPLATLTASSSELPLTGVRATGCISVSAGAVDLLPSQGIKPAGFFEKLAPMGQARSVKVEDITGAGPLRVATAPLPAVMRGIFWLTEQGRSSALASFAGPTKDGGGCSTGQLDNGKYKVRVGGDRVWAFADDKFTSWKFVEGADLIYNFVFDDGEKPTRVQIYPEVKKLDITLTAEWILDFEGTLLEGGHEEYPGSVVWKRPSHLFGKQVNEYALVQVINEHGERIEPAWTKFAQFQASDETGSEPGKIFYHEIQ